MNVNDPTLTTLRTALNQAIRARDDRAESVARVNIACAYLQMESPEARAAFDEALSAVRRAQNPRSEGILSMAFAPYFAENGDPARALELAQRGKEIARRGRIGHRVLSHIQLARVLYTGFSDAAQAGQAVDLALAALAEAEIANATDREVVLQAAAQAARAASAAGDMERALALLRIVDPATADRLRQQRPRLTGALKPAQRQELKRLYEQWRVRFVSAKSADRRLTEMAEKITDALHWDKGRAERSASSGNADAVCEFVERVHGVANGSQTMRAAIAAGQLPITDDDLVFTLGLATDRNFNSVLPAWAVFQLVGESAKDPLLVGRCFRLAAAMGHQGRDPRELLSLLQRADAALAIGVDDRLHVEVINEIAVCQLNLRQPESALHSAKRAAALATKTGHDALERMARGNVANALLQLQRVAEAREIFETLARDQMAAGEREMAQITYQNIEACRSLLRRLGKQS